MRKIFYNKYAITNLLVAVILITSFFFFSYSSGITGRTNKSGQGCNCHGPNPTSLVSTVISGPQTLSPGGKANYRLTITGGPLVRAGANIAASSGTLSVIAGSGLKKVGDELTQTSPKAPQGGIVTFDFEYTAPNNVGTVTLYASGNSVNLDGSTDGDSWNFSTNFTINVTTTSVENNNLTVNDFVLYQNYPNPINPSTIISYNLNKDENVTLKIYNSSGEEISTLVDQFQHKGKYEIIFEADKYNLSSGVYYYQINVNGIKETRKLIYLR